MPLFTREWQHLPARLILQPHFCKAHHPIQTKYYISILLYFLTPRSPQAPRRSAPCQDRNGAELGSCNSPSVRVSWPSLSPRAHAHHLPHPTHAPHVLCRCPRPCSLRRSWGAWRRRKNLVSAGHEGRTKSPRRIWPNRTLRKLRMLRGQDCDPLAASCALYYIPVLEVGESTYYIRIGTREKARRSQAPQPELPLPLHTLTRTGANPRAHANPHPNLLSKQCIC